LDKLPSSMNREAISVGVVVRDSFGREGIVCSEEVAPAENWINEQIGSGEIRRSGGAVQWWGIMPFGGGYLLCPQPELQRLRPASYDDFLAAADTGGADGRECLAKIFPHYVDRLLKERRTGGTR
jgi:hypothetical protein